MNELVNIEFFLNEAWFVSQRDIRGGGAANLSIPIF